MSNELFELQKAITGSGVEFQTETITSKVLEEMANRKNPVRNVIPRRAGDKTEGVKIYWVGSSVSPTTIGIVNVFATTATSIATSTGTVYSHTFEYKNIGEQGSVQLFEAMRGASVLDLETSEAERVVGIIKEREQWMFFWGASSASTSGTVPASAGLEFDGIYTLAAQATSIWTGLSTSRVGTLGTAATTLTLDKLSAAMNEVKGGCDAIFVSQGGLAAIQAAAYDLMEVAPGTPDLGLQVHKFSQVPIYVSSAIPDTISVSGTTGLIVLTSVSYGGATYGRYDLASGDTTAIFFINTEYVEFRYLQELTKQDFQTSSLQKYFDITEVLTLVVRDPYGIYVLVDVKPGA